MEERRQEGGRLIRAGGQTHAAIARHLGVSRSTVGDWAKALHAAGDRPEALRGRPRTGRPPKLNPSPWQQVLEALGKGAIVAGHLTERRTPGRVRALIVKSFGVADHPNYLSERLTALGWSVQKPQPRARERDDERVDAWRRHDWPRIQKKARRRGAEIAFVDETGFSFRDGVATTWAPRGRPPVLRRKGARRAISTAVALTLSGRVLWRHFDRSVRGVEARAFLRSLRRCARGPLTVIRDGLSAHRSPEVKRYLVEHPEVEIEALPPYAPDLNPEEFCHGNVKQRMRNTLPETPSAIRRQADRGFTRLRRRRDLLLGFFRHAGLRVRRLT